MRKITVVEHFDDSPPRVRVENMPNGDRTKKVLVIVITKDYVRKECYDALLAQDYDNYSILIHVAKPGFKHKNWLTEQNVNISENREQARRLALNSDANYFLFVDADVVIPRHALSELTKQISVTKEQTPAFETVSNNVGKIKSTYEQKHIIAGWYRFKVRGGSNKIKGGVPGWCVGKLIADNTVVMATQSFPSVMKVDYIGLGCVLVTRELLEKVRIRPGNDKTLIFANADYRRGVLDESGDFCNQVAELGYQIYSDGDVVCEHLAARQNIVKNFAEFCRRRAARPVNRIKIYALYSRGFEKLKNNFVRSIKDDWEVHVEYVGDDDGGDFGDPFFKKLLGRRPNLIADKIKENEGGIIIFSDVDIQFFRKCDQFVRDAMSELDLLFLDEHFPSNEVCAGFIVIRCNQKTLKFFERIAGMDLDGLKYFDQTAINDILQKERTDILWATLPREFWAKSHWLPLPQNIIMHHANCTEAIESKGRKIGSLELKLSQLREVRAQVRRNRFSRFSKFANYITGSCRQVRFKAQTFLFNVFSRSIPRHGRYLFAAPIGKTEKLLFEKLLKQFGHQDFDYVIFVYDGTTFNEPIYEQCKIIREAGAKWYFAKKYLTPEFCSKYACIFVWDGDVDVETFSYKNFMDVVKRNNLEMAQPALAATMGSCNYHNHQVTLKDASYPIGRYTDFVEVMIPVFRQDAWVKFWNMLEDNYNCWGWGYDFLAKSVCGYKNMGIVDCEAVTHTRPPHASPADMAERQADMEKFFQFNRGHAMTRFSAYGGLK